MPKNGAAESGKREWTSVSWEILTSTDENLTIESGALGMSKVALARLLLDWGIGQLRRGNVRLPSRSGIASAEGADGAEDQGDQPEGGRGDSTRPAEVPGSHDTELREVAVVHSGTVAADVA
jgi:hypothetical protein